MKTAEIMFHQKTKTNKPLIERRRRERMNNSLMQLKTLVLRGTNKEEHIRLEKADILEMTIRYIEDQQQRNVMQEAENSRLFMQCFIQGYSSCVNEVSKSLDVHWLDGNIKSGLSNHLSSTLYNMTTSHHHQTSSSHISPVPSPCIYDQRMVTSTPYSSTPAFHRNDRVNTHCYSPGSDWYSSTSTSPSSFSSDSASPSSVHSDSVSELSSLTCSTADNTHLSPVWRPW